MSMNIRCDVTYPAGAQWEVHDGWSSSGLVQTPTTVTYRILGISQRALERARRTDPVKYAALLGIEVLGLQPCFDRYATWRTQLREETLKCERDDWAPDPDEPDGPQTWGAYAKQYRQWGREGLARLKDQLEKALADGAVITWRAG